jgi:xylulokinase
MEHLIAYDLGTGGLKACLFRRSGELAASVVLEYPTLYPAPGRQEQRPGDWWAAVARATPLLLERGGAAPGEICALALSGHSLGVVALDGEGELVFPTTPIWSDSRAAAQAARFFLATGDSDGAAWYRATGGGFPAHLYSIFKLMWYAENQPEAYSCCAIFLGSKDYVNYRLTGALATDHSYASGSGAYRLNENAYDPELLLASGVPREKLCEPVESYQVIGGLQAAAARELGLPQGLPVVAGGVDNACMALGADCMSNGHAYLSLGSSAWIAVSVEQPLLRREQGAYTFRHCVPGQYVSAISTFSAGRSLRWARDVLFPDIAQKAKAEGADPYDRIAALAAEAPPGADGLLFNPALSGGSSENGADLRGGFAGLDLAHTRADLARAVLEGIAMELRLAVDALRELADLRPPLLMAGGGAKSPLWRGIFADMLSADIAITEVDQNAAALGAAALAAKGVGLWEDFTAVGALHGKRELTVPVSANAALYASMALAYRAMAARDGELARIRAGCGGGYVSDG